MFQSQYQINTTDANLLSSLQVNYNNKSIAKSWYTPRGRKSQKKNQTRKDYQRWEKDYWGLLEVCMYSVWRTTWVCFLGSSALCPTHPRLRSHCSNSLLKNMIWELETKQKSLSERVAFRKINRAHHLSFPFELSKNSNELRSLQNQWNSWLLMTPNFAESECEENTWNLKEQKSWRFSKPSQSLVPSFNGQKDT